ncbi:MAG TPA: cobalamin-binding protein, partial [Blastocatellia bacterium]
MTSSCSTRHPTPANGRAVTDELGRSVNVAADPQRIVSLAPSITEILFALGLGDRVVGVTS